MKSNYICRSVALLAFATVIVSSACAPKDTPPPASNAPAREIQLAPTTSVPPQLNDVPVRTAEASAPTPAPKPKKKVGAPKAVAKAPAPEPAPQVVVTKITPAPEAPAAVPAAAPAPPTAPMGTIEAGRTLAVSPTTRVCSTAQKVGDEFTATLGLDAQGSNGLVIPAGSPVRLRVIQSARSQNSKDSVKLAFTVVSVRVGNETYAVDGRVRIASALELVRAQSTGDQAAKVGAGAAIGALAGQLLGRNTKSTVIGGVVGAAAGAAVAAGTADYDGCVPPTGVLTITLGHPLVVKVAAG